MNYRKLKRCRLNSSRLVEIKRACCEHVALTSSHLQKYKRASTVSNESARPSEKPPVPPKPDVPDNRTSVEPKATIDSGSAGTSTEADQRTESAQSGYNVSSEPECEQSVRASDVSDKTRTEKSVAPTGDNAEERTLSEEVKQINTDAVTPSIEVQLADAQQESEECDSTKEEKHLTSTPKVEENHAKLSESIASRPESTNPFDSDEKEASDEPVSCCQLIVRNAINVQVHLRSTPSDSTHPVPPPRRKKRLSQTPKAANTGTNVRRCSLLFFNSFA